MSIQYSISYDETGSPSLVKNTIEGPKQVVRTSFNIGKFEPTRTRTISDFANVSSFDDIEAERGVEPVTKSLQKYIYQQTTNSDGTPDDNTTQTKTFSQMDFDARVAKNPITVKVLVSPFANKSPPKEPNALTPPTIATEAGSTISPLIPTCLAASPAASATPNCIALKGIPPGVTKAKGVKGSKT